MRKNNFIYTGHRKGLVQHRVKKIKIILIAILPLFIGLRCNTDNKVQNAPTPPPDFDSNECALLKLRNIQKLRDGEICIVFNDTFKQAVKGYYLDSIIEKKYKIKHVRVFNKYFEFCIQPIMDSAIAAKYGVNAKESIINEAYRLTEIAYESEMKK